MNIYLKYTKKKLVINKWRQLLNTLSFLFQPNQPYFYLFYSLSLSLTIFTSSEAKMNFQWVSTNFILSHTHLKHVQATQFIFRIRYNLIACSSFSLSLLSYYIVFLKKKTFTMNTKIFPFLLFLYWTTRGTKTDCWRSYIFFI